MTREKANMRLPLWVAITIIASPHCHSYCYHHYSQNTRIITPPSPRTPLFHNRNKPPPQHPSRNVALSLWPFSNPDKKKRDKKKRKKQNTLETNSLSSSFGTMSKTATTMSNFKQTQEIGKRTAALMEELKQTSIEGVAAGGKVKVFVDGQQRPKGVEIDEGFLEKVVGEDLVDAITSAMRDAHEKSRRVMEEKVKGLYVDVGFSDGGKV